MAEPTLNEISNITADPERSGIESVPVIDNSALVTNLNNAARFHSENLYKRYTDFLQNKKDLFASISDIQGLETLPEDKEYLNKQAGDILGDILKNPSVVAGGRGYDEIQAKIAKFKSDAMGSKASNLDDKANKQFLERNPDLYTDENIAAMEQNKKVPIGQRKSVTLKMPTILDEKTLFETALKTSTQPFTDVVDKEGKPGEGYIQTGLELNPKALQGQMDLALEGQKDKYGHSIRSAVEANYNRLPEEAKNEYKKRADENGTNPAEEYWKDRTKQYLNAYLPEGTYDETKQGTYRFGKTLKPDPNYLGSEKLGLEQQKLAEKTSNDKAEREIGWAHIGIDREKLNKSTKEDQDGAATVLNEAVSTIKNGEPITVTDERTGKTHNEIRISDPTVLQSFENVDRKGKTNKVPDAMRFNPETNQVTLLYGKPNKTGGFNTEKEIPLDQRTWLKIITKRSYPNKDIGGVNSLTEQILQANNGSLYEVFKKETETNDNAAKTNDASYYSDQNNLQSQDGNKLTFKDGTVWEYKNGKLKKIK